MQGSQVRRVFSADVPNIGRQYWANHFALIFLKGKSTKKFFELWVGGGVKRPERFSENKNLFNINIAHLAMKNVIFQYFTLGIPNA